MYIFLQRNAVHYAIHVQKMSPFFVVKWPLAWSCVTLVCRYFYVCGRVCSLAVRFWGHRAEKLAFSAHVFPKVVQISLE